MPYSDDAFLSVILLLVKVVILTMMLERAQVLLFEWRRYGRVAANKGLKAPIAYVVAAFLAAGAAPAAGAGHFPNDGSCKRLERNDRKSREALFDEMTKTGRYVILFRHGEKGDDPRNPLKPKGNDALKKDKCPSKKNLTPVGIEQAETVGRGLAKRGIEIGAAYASPCFRTYDTGRYVLKHANPNLELKTDRDLLRPDGTIHGLLARDVMRLDDKSNAILVSHGDVIPGYLRRLTGRTAATPDFLEAAILKQLDAGNGELRYRCDARILCDDWTGPEGARILCDDRK